MTTFTPTDEKYMARAMKLASLGEGLTSPNPMVGAVLVKEERIIAEGFHHKAGEPHAEAIALTQAKSAAKNSTLYVNLEPCNHHGRTPPCTDAIIRSGINRVVIATLDPNQHVTGGGAEKLTAAGIKVEVGLLEKKATVLNEKYLFFVKNNTPFVIMKAGITLDGKIATKTGESQWITSPRARKIAHKIRKSVDAVAVGAGTLLADDPRLTVRTGTGQVHSHRIVFDTHLRTPLDSNIISNNYEGTTFILTSKHADPHKIVNLESQGAKIIKLPRKNDRVSIPHALEQLAKRNVCSIMLEGGGELFASFIKESAVQKLVMIIAPTIIGGTEAIPVIGELGIDNLRDAVTLKEITWKKLGDEVIFTGYF